MLHGLKEWVVMEEGQGTQHPGPERQGGVISGMCGMQCVGGRVVSSLLITTVFHLKINDKYRTY